MSKFFHEKSLKNISYRSFFQGTLLSFFFLFDMENFKHSKEKVYLFIYKFIGIMIILVWGKIIGMNQR